MYNKSRRFILAATTVVMTAFATPVWAEGLMTIIVNDPSNPYWLTEGDVAQKTAEKWVIPPRLVRIKAIPTPKAN